MSLFPALYLIPQERLRVSGMIRLCVEVCICVGGEDKRKSLGSFRALTENDAVVATGAAVQAKTEADFDQGETRLAAFAVAARAEYPTRHSPHRGKRRVFVLHTWRSEDIRRDLRCTSTHRSALVLVEGCFRRRNAQPFKQP